MSRTYHITYDAFKEQWKVMATWPGPDGQPITFCCSTHNSMLRAKHAALEYRRADERRKDQQRDTD